MTGSVRRRAGLRRGRIAIAGVISAAAVMAFGVASAQAADQPLHITYDDAALNVGVQFDILDPPATATMDGTWNDNGTNAVAVPAAGFVFPSFTGDAFPGVPVTVDFSAVDPIAGTYVPATGALNLASSTYHATVHLLGAVCNYNIELALTTNPGSPFNGDPFAGTPPTALTNGAIADGWAAGENAADPNPNCNTINTLVTGSGGLAMGNGIDLTPAAAASPTPVAPAPAPAAKKKCKKSKKGKKSASAAKKSKCKKTKK